MFTVYALYSPAFNKIYIGYTTDLNNCFLSHNELATNGYTIKYHPWLIAYTETAETKVDTFKRELQLKSAQGRVFVWNIISEQFIRSDD